VVPRRKIESFMEGYIQMQLYAPCNTQRDNNFLDPEGIDFDNREAVRALII